MAEPFCDPNDDSCKPADLAESSNNSSIINDLKIFYVGDPMCSWCYGIAPELRKLIEQFPEIEFKVIVGGLRPGGGDEWNDAMKQMLKHHWEEVEKRSGQKFSHKLFELDQFNYDTEPSCRAVVAARKWLGEYDFSFFEEVQKQFYYNSQDPTLDSFYQPVCEKFNIPFDEFLVEYKSAKTKEKTYGEFQLNRSWGITGYPTVVLQKEDDLFSIARGYAEFEDMKLAIEKINHLKTNDLQQQSSNN